MNVSCNAALRCPPFVAPLVLAFAAPAVAADQTPSFACLMEPKMVLKLGTPVPGLLSEVLVDRGDFIKKGDIVARLESGVKTAMVALAKAKAANESALQSAHAKLNFQMRKAGRAMELRRNDNIAVSTADEAETGAQVAEAELNQARVDQQIAQLDLTRTAELLNQRTIRIPIDGIVMKRT